MDEKTRALLYALWRLYLVIEQDAPNDVRDWAWDTVSGACFDADVPKTEQATICHGARCDHRKWLNGQEV